VISAILKHRLLLDIQGSQSVAHGERGIARYVMEHAMALMRRSDGVRALLLNPLLALPGHLPATLMSSPLLRWSTATEIRKLERDGPFALHIMSPFELLDPSTSVVPTHLMRPDVPVIVTLYDLIPYLMPDRYLADPAFAKRYLQRIETVRAATLVLAISEATRRDAIRELGIAPDRVVNILGGVGTEFVPAAPGTDPAGDLGRVLPEIGRPYIFTVAGAEFRKNTERLIEAYATLPASTRSRHQLVITCALPPGWRDSWLEHARRAGCADGDVVLTGRVDDRTLVRLYRAARLFVFPSLYEGFGLPVAEAISCGTPSVTSNASSLPEILDHPPATFDPTDVDDMARVIEGGLTDDVFRHELTLVARTRAASFRWDAVADRTLEAVATVVDRTLAPRRTGHRRLKVALVTPLPPEANGIATYSGRLIPHLAGEVDLDVLYPNQSEKPSPQPAGVTCLPVSGLGRYLNPNAYDAVVYAVGNHPVHIDTYEAMVRYAGIVWFHDVRLPHLYWHRAEAARVDPRRAISDQLDHYYTGRAPVDAAEQWSVTFADRFGLNLTPELAQGARHAIVHSKFAERMLRLDQGAGTRCPPISVLPLAAAPLRPEGPATRIQPPVVGALGLVDERKSPLLLIEAVALIPTLRRPRLMFIGFAEEWKRAWLSDHAHRAGLPAGSVTVTGWLDDQAWRDRIAALTCAVQLRAASNGESSASVRDALACGVPVVTNMIGADDEFPSGSVKVIPSEVGPVQLAAAIDEVCSDAGVWQSLADAGWSYSESVTPQLVAEQLAEVVRQAVAAGGRGPGAE
jgi:glycosyltransferase involved in cell wall biosynthesis